MSNTYTQKNQSFWKLCITLGNSRNNCGVCKDPKTVIKDKLQINTERKKTKGWKEETRISLNSPPKFL